VQLHPQIAAPWSDDAPQREAQTALFAALEAWRASPGVAPIMASLEEYGRGAEFRDCRPLAGLFAPGGEAASLAADFADTVARALRDTPLGHVPLRHFTDSAVSTLLLARCERAALFLTAVSGAALAGQPPPVTVSFASTEGHEAILAGEARADRARLDDNGLNLESVALMPGTVLARDCRREALVLREVRGTLVALRLQRRLEVPLPTREVDLATGHQVHQAAARAEDSRSELMVALLGRMGRTDAAPVLARVASGGAPMGLRWQALRECLALDTAIGFAALSGLARASGDALAVPAGALRAQLIEIYPQLAKLDACPV
jgi:hypothetical protein